ncbi:MAG: PrpF domain-containing protein, partial [Rhodospirillaceae bacterium]
MTPSSALPSRPPWPRIRAGIDSATREAKTVPDQTIPCLFMRGGTSRGPFFRKADLPSDIPERDRVLLAAMGSPDTRPVDGLGGADT